MVFTHYVLRLKASSSLLTGSICYMCGYGNGKVCRDGTSLAKHAPADSAGSPETKGKPFRLNNNVRRPLQLIQLHGGNAKQLPP
jgi:hypothetical protein